MPEILPLAGVPASEVEALLDAAFGADRRGRTAYRLREGMPWLPELSFAIVEVGKLVGSLQSWPVALATPAGKSVPLVLVGPVAVAPELQRSGHGKALMNRLIEAADRGGADAMAMIGDPEYYDRFFGFTADATGGWAVPGPVERRRLLARNTDFLPRTGVLGPRTFALADTSP
jgi:predicted N-acetyltransferase YhbS